MENKTKTIDKSRTNIYLDKAFKKALQIKLLEKEKSLTALVEELLKNWYEEN